MALPLISEWIRIQILDRIAVVAEPDLTKPLVFGTTPGIKDKNKLLVFKDTRDAMASFDASTPEYQMLEKIFSQSKVYPRPEKCFVWNITRSDYRLASLVTGNLWENNALQWYADKFGDWGDRFKVALRNTQSGNSTLQKTVTSSLDVGSGNAGVQFTQTEPLDNVVRIEFVDPQKPGKPLSVTVVNEYGVVPNDRVDYRTLQGYYDYTIRISLQTNAMEEVVTTADDIFQALTNPAHAAYNPLAASLVDVTLLGDGSGVVEAFPKTPIPVQVTIDLADDGTNVTTRAWQLRDFVNSDPVLAPLFLVSNYNVSDGTGVVYEETAKSLVPQADPNPEGIADSYTGLRLAANDNVELAIQFTPTADIKVASAFAKLRKVGNVSSSKYVWFEVQTDATGLPSGTAVATSGKINAASISATGQFVEFKFPKHISLTANTTYHLVLKGDYTESTTAYIAVATDDVTSGGVSEIKDATWANDETKNFAFRLFAEAADVLIPVTRENTPPSPLELVRGLNAMEQYATIAKVSVPYFVCCTSLDEVPGDRLELSQAMAAREGIYITTNTIEEATNVLQLRALMEAMNSDRTGFIAHTNPEVNRPDAAVVGLFSSMAAAAAAGSIGLSNRAMTLFWGRLNGIAPAKFNSTERQILFSNAPGVSAAIIYQEDFGNQFLTGSWATDGSFLDWRWQKDYIKLRLTLAYYRMFVEGPPTYDNPGIGRIEATTVNEMNRLTKQGFIAAWDNERSVGIYEVRCPRIHQVSSDDHARRIYRFTVRAQPAWAIEQLDAIYEFSFMGNVFASGT